jgi:hypothetical protein
MTGEDHHRFGCDSGNRFVDSSSQPLQAVVHQKDLHLCQAFQQISLGMTQEEVEGILGSSNKTTIRNSDTNELTIVWSKENTTLYAAFELDRELFANSGNRVSRLHDKTLMTDPW